MSDQPPRALEAALLLDAYYEAAGGEDNLTLPAFVAQVLPHHDPLAVDQFLDQVEQIVLGNIEEKLTESPGAFPAAQAAADAIRAELAAARELLAARL